jgi:hypothetical protein
MNAAPPVIELQSAAVEMGCFDSCVSAERPSGFPRITAGEHIRRKIAATHGGIE